MENNFSLSRIAILAQINKHGKLERVENIKEKIEALMEIDNIQLCFIPKTENLHEHIDCKKITFIKVGCFNDVIEEIQNRFGPKSVLRDLAIEDYKNMPFIGKIPNLGKFKERIYQELFLIEPINKNDRVTDFSDPGYIRKEIIINGNPKIIVGKLVTLEELLDGFRKTQLPRIILLGEPGCGKSAYLRYIGKKVAENQLSVKGNFGILTNLDQLVSLRIDISEWLEIDQSILDYLIEKTGIQRQHLLSWLNYGDIFLLIDQLENIAGNPVKSNEFCAFLDQAKSCPVLITCDISSEQSIKQIDLGPTTLVFMNSMTEQDRKSFIEAHFKGKEIDRVSMFDRLDSFIDQDFHTQNPFFLSLLCSVGESISTITKRTEFYGEMVDRIFSHFIENQKDRVIFLTLLEYFAFCATENEINGFPDFAYEQVMQNYEEFSYFPDTRKPDLDELLTYYQDLKFLSCGYKSNKRVLYFTRKSFQQFLSACWINRMITNPSLPPKGLNINSFISKLSWNVSLQHTLVYLCGMIENPLDHIRNLLENERDDIFLHQTTLAILCLNEIDLEDYEDGREIDEKVSERLFTHYFSLNEETHHTREITDAINFLFLRNAKYQGTPIINFIISKLREPLPNADVRNIFRAIHSHSLPPELELAIYNLLNSDNKRTALTYISILGPSLSRSELVINELIVLLDNSELVDSVLGIIGKMDGEIVLQDTLIKVLLSKLKNAYKAFLTKESNASTDRLFEPMRRLLESIKSLRLGRHSQDLAKFLEKLVADPSLGENKIYVIQALAETDINEDNYLIFVEAVNQFIRSNNRDLRGMSRVAFSRALQSSKNISIRGKMIAQFTKENFLNVEYFNENLFPRDREQFERIIKDKENDQIKAVNYFFSNIGRIRKTHLLSDEEVYMVLLDWLISGNHEYESAAYAHLSEMDIMPTGLVSKLIEIYYWGRGYYSPGSINRVLSLLGKFIQQENSSSLLNALLNVLASPDEEIDLLILTLVTIQEFPDLTIAQAAGCLNALEIFYTKINTISNADPEKVQIIKDNTISAMLHIIIIAKNGNHRLSNNIIQHYATMIFDGLRDKPGFPYVDEVFELDRIGIRIFRVKNEKFDLKLIA